ncbi:Histone deacetylase family protein [Brugia malayi]|uniref:Bm6726 n=1 Tax=Brugia malayi TaxID=6279 RepID=A0A0K0JPD9_BRUMA|nr:Histone deacetylase family protein [Brugia malayi]CDP93901.1 Bm6726 [Brugia malayi]VIO93385.1 Histone deacetylase family protein [Brugia malayi]
MKQRKVYIGTDRAMLQHRCEWDYHLEHPERLSAVLEKLESSGLLNRCIHLKPKKANLEDLCLVHSRTYVERIAQTRNMDLEELEKIASTFDDVYFNNYSYEAAAISVGISLQAMEAVLFDGERKSSSFAIIRPPGHHASRERACGFCIFNNVAICARTLGVEKVLIVDWDVHAGQGTQYAVEDDPKIKLISIHRYQHGLFWPHLPESAISHGYKNTINVPLNGVGMGDSEYIAFVQHFVVPIIYDFVPSLILISSGFDAGFGDEEGNMNVSPAGYYWMTKLILDAATTVGSPLCMLMEGGYFIDSLAYGVQFCIKALLNDPEPHIEVGLCSHVFLHSLHSAVLFHASEFPRLQLLADVTSHIRVRSLVPAITPIKTEYKYQKVSDGQDDIYPTRGIYVRPAESLIERLQQELQEIISNSYSTKNKEAISLVFTQKINEENTEKEIQIEVKDLEHSAVVDFIQLHVLNTPCIKLILSEKNRMDQLKYTQNNCSEDTVISIVESLFKLFNHQHCINFKHLLDFELDLT